MTDAKEKSRKLKARALFSNGTISGAEVCFSGLKAFFPISGTGATDAARDSKSWIETIRQFVDKAKKEKDAILEPGPIIALIASVTSKSPRNGTFGKDFLLDNFFVSSEPADKTSKCFFSRLCATQEFSEEYPKAAQSVEAETVEMKGKRPAPTDAGNASIAELANILNEPSGGAVTADDLVKIIREYSEYEES